MSGVLASVDKRTQLVGENRLELLLFYLHSRHLFALNVFKVKEVVKLPQISKIPHAHPKVSGVVNIRGESIPVIDLRRAINMPEAKHIEDTNLVITEYNRTVQGFLIGKVDQIINMTWSDIMPPPTAIGKNHYLTALTKLKRDDQEQLVEIIDVEKVLAEIVEYVSSFITLQPGDLLIAGTPQRTEKLALKAGDTVAIEIEQIGRLENPVVAEQEITQ